MESTTGKKGYEPSTITIYIKNHGIVLKESSMLLIHSETNKIAAIGNEAEEHMLSPIPPAIAVNPLRRGIIASYTSSLCLFRYFLSKARRSAYSPGKRILLSFFSKPKVAVCVPEPLTEVEEKAFTDVFYQAGAKKVTITELSLDQAITALSDDYPFIVGIVWNG